MIITSEIGKNWITSEKEEDYLNNAKELILASKNAGADLIKIQVHVSNDELKKRSKEREEWIKRNEAITTDEFLKEIFDYANSLDIEMFGTGMSTLAAKKLNPFVRRHKISSADIVDIELLKYLKSTKKPIILSTGMSTAKQINKAVEFLGEQIDFINYCVSLYPCPIYKIDFEKMVLMKYMYERVGFSDHSLSIDAPVLAVRMGAVAIEKHFTLNRNDFGPDHKVSLLPDEFKRMVELCKLAETDGESFEEEKQFWSKFRTK